METLTIFNEHITLGQLLKDYGLTSTGGQAKIFLEENEGKVFVNTEAENRRGRKLYSGDFIDFPEHNLSIILKEASKEQLLELERIKELEKKMNERRKQKKENKFKKPRSPFQK